MYLWPGVQPIDELDAKLEGSLCALHELGFVELDKLIVLLDGRDSRFANADGADRFAFDQLNIVEALEQFSEQSGGHPTCRTAADDENLAHGQSVSGYPRGKPRSPALRSGCPDWTVRERQAVAAGELDSALLWQAVSRRPIER